MKRQYYWVKRWCSSCIRWEGGDTWDSHPDLNEAYQWAEQYVSSDIIFMVVDSTLEYHPPPV